MTNSHTQTLDHRCDQHRADHGFTLIEIVIAIVLVGILSAVAVVGIGSLTSKGSDAACTASLDAAKAGSVVHLASNAAYPTTLTQMTTANPATLSLPTGVTLTSPTVASGQGWTLTMTPGTSGGAPTFSCGGSAGSGTAASGTTACPGAYAGWVGEYYSNIALTGSPALCRDDATLSFNWGGGGAGSGLPVDNFSVRWTKTVTFTAATYIFTIGSDDGSRLYIDGTLVNDWWTDHGYGTQTVSRAITAGSHTIVLEFYERGGSAQATLAWA